MKRLILATIAAGTLVAAAAPAYAAQGCGPGFHRGPHGRCFPNGGPGYGPRGPAFGPRGPVIGTFYPGRGYWDGHRYWHDRYRDRGNWRYR